MWHRTWDDWVSFAYGSIDLATGFRRVERSLLQQATDDHLRTIQGVVIMIEQHRNGVGGIRIVLA